MKESSTSPPLLPWNGGLATALRAVAEGPSGLPLRLTYDFWHGSQEKRKVKAASDILGIPRLKDPGSGGSQSDVLFLLGSGESVEELSSASWELVSQHYSVGINAWPLHSFVPDAYCFEPFDPASTDYVQLFSTVLHEKRILRLNPRLLLFRPNSRLDVERYRLIPEALKGNAEVYGRVVPSTRTQTLLASEIKSLQWLLRHHLPSDSLVVDLGATVIRMVSLGMLMGYTRIVLVGVDLNGGGYFWERNPQHLADRGISSFSPGFVRPIHETMVKGAKAFILTEVLNSLQQILNEKGGSLYAGSTSSLLAKDLPVYGWPETT